MTEDRTPRASDEPTTATKQRKKRKWDQPADDVVSAAAAAAAVAGLPVLNLGALCGVQFPGTTAYPAAPLPNAVPAPYALPPQLAPSVLQSAAVAIQKLSQAKIPDELIAREVVINDADPSVRYNRISSRNGKHKTRFSDAHTLSSLQGEDTILQMHSLMVRSHSIYISLQDLS